MPFTAVNELLVDELRRIYSADAQMVAVLPLLAIRITMPTLVKAVNDQLARKHRQVGRLDQIFGKLQRSPLGTTCMAMKRLIAEGIQGLELFGTRTVLDGEIAAAVRRMGRYEIATYDCAHAFAAQLNHREIASLLRITLAEERAANDLLNRIVETRLKSWAPQMWEREPMTT